MPPVVSCITILDVVRRRHVPRCPDLPWLGDDADVVEVEAPPKLARRVEVCAASKLPEPGTLRCVATKHGPLTIATTSDGAAYALQKRLPPFGLSTRFYGDFDGQVRTIKDRGSGTKFYVDSGDVRGPWCPAILPKRCAAGVPLHIRHRRDSSLAVR